MPSTMTPLELGWSVFCLFGALICAGLSRDVWADARKVNRDQESDAETRRKRVATTRVARALAFSKMYVLSVFVLIGCVTMTQPQQSNTSVTQVTAAIGFCSVAIVIVAVSIYWRYVRYRWLRDTGGTT